MQPLIGAVELELVSLLLAVSVYYVSGTPPAVWLVGILAASNASVLSIHLLLRANRKAYESKAGRLEFIECLNRTMYRKRAGRSYAKALVESAGEIRMKDLRESVFANARKRIMEWDGTPNGQEGYGRTWAEAEIRKQARSTDASRADVEERAQRYATFNMFLSTVLPSFLVFAFIGGSILSHAYFSMLLFSICLVFTIPVLYSFGNLLMWRRLFA